MNSEFSKQRSTQERVVIGTLILLGTLLLLGIQSLFLNHIAPALPADNLWRIITIGCFLAPPFAFAFLVLLKMNFSRSTSQDFILYGGMSLELLLFVINLIVAVNAQQIQGSMLGTIGVLLGGVAGVVSAGTTAFTLAADPLRGLAKSKLEHDLKIEKAAQTKTEALLEKAMSSPRVEAAAEGFAEGFVRERFEQVFGRRASDSPPAPPSKPAFPTPPLPREESRQPEPRSETPLIQNNAGQVNYIVWIKDGVARSIRYAPTDRQLAKWDFDGRFVAWVFADDPETAAVKAISLSEHTPNTVKNWGEQQELKKMGYTDEQIEAMTRQEALWHLRPMPSAQSDNGHADPKA